MQSAMGAYCSNAKKIFKLHTRNLEFESVCQNAGFNEIVFLKKDNSFVMSNKSKDFVSTGAHLRFKHQESTNL
jgi:hypothetical protein